MNQRPVYVKESIWKWPAILVTCVLGIPTMVALIKALGAIPHKMWVTAGIVLLGFILFTLLSFAAFGLVLWIKRPGQQLPDAFQGLERRLER